MELACTLRSNRHVFRDLKELMAKASEAKSGDMLAGIGARSETERVAAKMVLAELPLGRFLEEPLIDPAHHKGLLHRLFRHFFQAPATPGAGDAKSRD